MKKSYIIILIAVILLILLGIYLENIFANRIILETSKNETEEKEISTTYNIDKTNNFYSGLENEITNLKNSSLYVIVKKAGFISKVTPAFSKQKII